MDLRNITLQLRAIMWQPLPVFPSPPGCFPFDHVDNPDPNSRSAQMEVWAQQVHGRWHDLPAVAAVVNRVSGLLHIDSEHSICLSQVASRRT